MIEIVRKTQRNVKRWQTGDSDLAVSMGALTPLPTIEPTDGRAAR